MLVLNNDIKQSNEHELQLLCSVHRHITLDFQTTTGKIIYFITTPNTHKIT